MQDFITSDTWTINTWTVLWNKIFWRWIDYLDVSLMLKPLSKKKIKVSEIEICLEAFLLWRFKPDTSTESAYKTQFFQSWIWHCLSPRLLIIILRKINSSGLAVFVACKVNFIGIECLTISFDRQSINGPTKPKVSLCSTSIHYFNNTYSILPIFFFSVYSTDTLWLI